MKLQKLLHLLAVLALVACVPTAGPPFSPPTATPTTVAVVSTAATSPTNPTPSATIAQSPSIGPPSPTSPPTGTATAASSPTSSQPQWGNRTKTAGCIIQGPFPDPACTPGDIFPTVTAAQVCVSGYSSSVRDVPASEKDAVYAEYGITSHTTGQFEVDHFVSLEIGGSNDIANLFPEAADPKPGFHEKDRVENYLHDQVCNGAMALAVAQRTIATNWLAVYLSLAPGVGSSPTPGSVSVTSTPAQQIAPTVTQAQAATAAPTQTAARARIGAMCKDGSSSIATGSGACSGHKGVQCWKYSDGTCTNP